MIVVVMGMNVLADVAISLCVRILYCVLVAVKIMRIVKKLIVAVIINAQETLSVKEIKIKVINVNIIVNARVITAAPKESARHVKTTNRSCIISFI